MRGSGAAGAGLAYDVSMLFMVIERFRGADPMPVCERFRSRGRMMPDGLVYHASWLDPEKMRCFQVMEAPDAELLKIWMSRWDDLMEFEVVPVLTSAEFWAQHPGAS